MQQPTRPICFPQQEGRRREEDLPYNTVRFWNNDQTVGVGFFYRTKRNHTYIITARHVWAERPTKVTWTLHPGQEKGQPKQEAELAVVGNLEAVFSPVEDVIALRCDLTDEQERRTFALNEFYLIRSDDQGTVLQLGSKVNMYCFPERSTLLPVMRTGRLCVDPSEDVPEGRGNDPLRRGYTEMAVFEGDSGAPVFVVDRKRIRKGKVYFEQAVRLVGVHVAGMTLGQLLSGLSDPYDLWRDHEDEDDPSISTMHLRALHGCIDSKIEKQIGVYVKSSVLFDLESTDDILTRIAELEAVLLERDDGPARRQDPASGGHGRWEERPGHGEYAAHDIPGGEERARATQQEIACLKSQLQPLQAKIPSTAAIDEETNPEADAGGTPQAPLTLALMLFVLPLLALAFSAHD